MECGFHNVPKGYPRLDKRVKHNINSMTFQTYFSVLYIMKALLSSEFNLYLHEDKFFT